MMLKVRMMVEVSLLSGKQKTAGQEDKIDKLKLFFEQHSNLDIKSQSTWDYLIKKNLLLVSIKLAFS